MALRTISLSVKTSRSAVFVSKVAGSIRKRQPSKSQLPLLTAHPTFLFPLESSTSWNSLKRRCFAMAPSIFVRRNTGALRHPCPCSSVFQLERFSVATPRRLSECLEAFTDKHDSISYSKTQCPRLSVNRQAYRGYGVSSHSDRIIFPFPTWSS